VSKLLLANSIKATVDSTNLSSYLYPGRGVLCLCLTRPDRHPKKLVFENSGGRFWLDKNLLRITNSVSDLAGGVPKYVFF